MITPKNWGFEEEIVNVEYCGKRMFIKEGFRSSIHKHEKKDEVLVVSSGLVYFEVGLTRENVRRLHAGQRQDQASTWRLASFFRIERFDNV